MEWSEGALKGEGAAGAQRGQAEPSELQWRSGSPTFLWNTVFTLRSREEGGQGPGRGGGREGDDA